MKKLVRTCQTCGKTMITDSMQDWFNNTLFVFHFVIYPMFKYFMDLFNSFAKVIFVEVLGNK